MNTAPVVNQSIGVYYSIENYGLYTSYSMHSLSIPDQLVGEWSIKIRYIYDFEVCVKQFFKLTYTQAYLDSYSWSIEPL